MSTSLLVILTNQTLISMEDIIRHMLYEDEIPDYEFWEYASEWMM
jgi:hypothetical protein